MAPFFAPDPGDPGEQRVGTGSVGGSESLLELRLLRDGHQVIVRGSLICPGCELPLVVPGAIPIGERLECGFCSHSAPAREFVRSRVRDTVVNRVAMVARVARTS